MNPAPTCPVCDSVEWTEIGSREYRRDAGDRLGDYVQRRRRVLFEIWFPGQTHVTLHSLLCRRCGFVTYAPRPSEHDIDKKYRFLAGLGPDVGDLSSDTPGEQKRARRLLRKLSRYLPDAGGQVLDFGGGDGRLVLPFARRGYVCSVIDYTRNPHPAVRRLGATLEEAEIETPFNLIVCSHVIEHVANPLSILTRLRDHLKPGGTIYVEVPMEIWRKAPLQTEPVTHVNFFTDESTRVLLERAGYSHVHVSLERYAHPGGHRTVVVSAVGRWTSQLRPQVRYDGAAKRTRELLNPRWETRLQRALLDPRRLPSTAMHKLAFCGRQLFSTNGSAG